MGSQLTHGDLQWRSTLSPNVVFATRATEGHRQEENQEKGEEDKELQRKEGTRGIANAPGAMADVIIFLQCCSPMAALNSAVSHPALLRAVNAWFWSKLFLFHTLGC